MHYLRSIGMVELAEIYGPTRDRVVESRMTSLRNEMNRVVALPVARV